MKIAVMQPYFFPYIGYFQLINLVDHFVFYDDVNYIKGGWINRNRILSNGKDFLFTIPLEKSSSFKTIQETYLHPELYFKWKVKFIKTIEQSYKKAPHFDRVLPLIENVLSEGENIAELSIKSIKAVCDFIGLNTSFHRSSAEFRYTKGLLRSERLIKISKDLKAYSYINMSGGKELYQKEDFGKRGIDLEFLEPHLMKYDQQVDAWVPGLSIIDVLMFNSPTEVANLMKQYTTK